MSSESNYNSVARVSPPRAHLLLACRLYLFRLFRWTLRGLCVAKPGRWPNTISADLLTLHFYSSLPTCLI